MIVQTHNHAGFPDGISGKDLLARMREQAVKFGARIIIGRIETLRKSKDLFEAEGNGNVHRARTVLLATGVVNNRPAIASDIHDIALQRGLLRYCPICDGYEVTDRRVAVIGTQTHGFNEAVFLRMYTANVTLIAPDSDHMLSDEERRKLTDADVRLVDGPCSPLRIAENSILVTTPHGELAFDSVYPALGSVVRSELAGALGAQMTADGCLVVDAHQRTTLPGVYAAGDVAKGLDQISHAMGEAGVAATTIRNDLAAMRPLLR